MDLVERVVRVADAWLFVRERRLESSGPPVVFLHGIGESGECFREAFESSFLKNHSLIVIDQAGYGRSSAAENGEYGFRLQIKRLLEALEKLNVSQFHLVGHSMGGDIGAQMCLDDRGNRIISFINVEGDLTREDMFISKGAAEASEAGQFEQWFTESFRDSEVLCKMLPTRSSHARYFASLQFARPEAFRQNAVEIYRTHMEKEPSGFGCNYRDITGIDPLFCHAGTLNQAGVEFLSKNNLDSEVFHGSGHWLMIDEANRFYSIVSRHVGAE